MGSFQDNRRSEARGRWRSFPARFNRVGVPADSRAKKPLCGFAIVLGLPMIAGVLEAVARNAQGYLEMRIVDPQSGSSFAVQVGVRTVHPPPPRGTQIVFPLTI
jgi:hypothetical protein